MKTTEKWSHTMRWRDFVTAAIGLGVVIGPTLSKADDFKIRKVLDEQIKKGLVRKIDGGYQVKDVSTISARSL